jgi:rhamnogalacturonyl hydrolase YesR
LAVAYDMTGKQEYLDTCRRWSDRMIDYQNQMIPKGAYYLNYFRKPGQIEEMWFISDASSEAMGVLATAVRCTQQADRDRYLNSVKLYADVVMEESSRPCGATFATSGGAPPPRLARWHFCSTGRPATNNISRLDWARWTG